MELGYIAFHTLNGINHENKLIDRDIHTIKDVKEMHKVAKKKKIDPNDMEYIKLWID